VKWYGDTLRNIGLLLRSPNRFALEYEIKNIWSFKKLKTKKNIKKKFFFNKMLFYFDWKLCKKHILKNINTF